MYLFCFTYAGGTSSFFEQLESYLEPAILLVKLEYAGHGTRHRESLYKNFQELAADMYEHIREVILSDNTEDYALLGYSMGSIAVVEVLKQIMQEQKLPLPVHVFLAAHEPHTKSELKDFRSGEMDENIKKRTIQFGGIPERLINNKSFWRMYLPIYRADYSMIGDYDFESLGLQSMIPATVFYSETDTPLEEMKKWRNFFRGECEFVQYEGNHFFIKEHCQEMSRFIYDTLKEHKI